MSQIRLPQLSKHQLLLLNTVAQEEEVPIFLLPRPVPDDTVKERNLLEKRHHEVMQLIELGLVEDVTNEFSQHVNLHRKRTGRTIKVFGLSEVAYLMFRRGVPKAIN